MKPRDLLLALQSVESPLLEGVPAGGVEGVGDVDDVADADAEEEEEEEEEEDVEADDVRVGLGGAGALFCSHGNAEGFVEADEDV